MGKHTGESQKRFARRARTAKRKSKQSAFAAVSNAEARTVVQWFRDCGAENPEIEERTGLNHDFVWRWAGRDNTAILPGRGPDPLIADPRAATLAKAIVKKRFHNAESLRAEVTNPKTGKMVTAPTITAALKRAGARNVRVLKGQMLTAKQRLRRLTWCQEQQEKKSHFRDWVFSDEKWWCLGGVQGNERLWVWEDDPYPDERYAPTVSNPIKVHIWGAISYDGRSSLHIHDGKIDSEVYCACIKDAFLPCLYESDYLALKKTRVYEFMQDGASCHTSAHTYDWLERNLPKKIKHQKKGEWPANSPDLNPIERLWSILQDRVIAKRAYTYDALVDVVINTWWELEQSTIRALFDSMPVRLEKCIHAEGGRFRV